MWGQQSGTKKLDSRINQQKFSKREIFWYTHFTKKSKRKSRFDHQYKGDFCFEIASKFESYITLYFGNFNFIKQYLGQEELPRSFL